MNVAEAHEIVGYPSWLELLAILREAVGERAEAAEVLRKEAVV